MLQDGTKENYDTAGKSAPTVAACCAEVSCLVSARCFGCSSPACLDNQNRQPLRAAAPPS
eukprot:4072282-Amphidinium_carterae.1